MSSEIGYLCAGMSFDVGKLELCIVGVHLPLLFYKKKSKSKVDKPVVWSKSLGGACLCMMCMYQPSVVCECMCSCALEHLFQSVYGV